MIENQDLDFTGRRVLVTGAAGGIGSAMAAAFAAHGGELIVADIEAEAVEKLARELGGDASFHQYDQSDAASIAALAAAVGSVDVLCNNAGMIQAGPFLEQSPEIIQRIIAINLTGPVLMARHIGEGMVARGRGVIVNTASQLAFHGSATRAAYAAAKSAILGLTRSLANEWAKHGIRTNAIAPGFIPTDLNRKFLEGTERGRRIIENTPMERFGTADEISGAAVFLSSPAASFVNGHTLVVDGGYLACGIGDSYAPWARPDE